MTPKRSYEVLKRSGSIIMACLCAATLTGSCKGHSFTQGDGLPPPEAHSFMNDLADEYQVLGDFAAAENTSPDIAAGFYGKATGARNGKAAPPEAIEKYKIPAFAVHELTQARHSLVEALGTVNVPDNGKMLAMAQVKFDCWLAYQQYQKHAGGYIGCREAFRQAMANVDFTRKAVTAKTKPSLNGPQVVHFADEILTLDQESHDKIAAIAEKALASDGTVILLVGHSKEKATIDDTSNNAVRRIIAVRNALYQNGVEPELVEVEFESDGSPLEVDLELHPGSV